MMRDLITVEDVLNSRLIAWPIHLLALPFGRRRRRRSTTAARARLRQAAGLRAGTGEAENVMISSTHDFTESRAFQKGRPRLPPARAERERSPMFYDVCAHAMRFGGAGFVELARAGWFMRLPPPAATTDQHQRRRPYTHTGMHCMLAPERPQLRARRGGAGAGRQDQHAHGPAGFFAPRTVTTTNQA
jgi:hypothetical protein